MTGGTTGGSDDSERLKELGHLSAAVGHHVINAFSAMVSNAELIRSHATDPKCNLAELVALATAIIENALTGSHVPRRLIDLTRRVTSPGFDQVGDPPGLIDLNQLIRDTVEARSSGSEGLEFSMNLGPIAMIRGNEPQLRSLLGYLIQNAREAMTGGAGKISFTTRMDPRNWVILEVRDTGIGMTPEVLKRATEPFFTTKPGRSGIGLSVAHGIWRRHRGALSIESQPGEGTMIRLAVEAPPTTDKNQAPTSRHIDPSQSTAAPAPESPRAAAEPQPLEG